MLNIQNIKIPGVKPINLDIAEGECVGISGGSGSGKTRFLRAIADMDVYEGDVYLENRSRDEFSGHTWRKKVCLLPAESQWWFDTVEEHFSGKELVAFSSLLDAVGFGDDILRWQLSRCSSGEKQRLAIIRALINKPRVLLLDEPTANLDAENSEKVESLVASYLKDNDAMAIWVSHNRKQLERVAPNGCFKLSPKGLVVATG
jgi:ABC-type lipoprotein export system ATPase subunit